MILSHPVSPVFGLPCGALQFTFAEAQPGPTEGHSKDSPSGGLTPQNRWSRMKLSRIWLSWGNSRFLRSLLGVSWVDEQRLGSARVTLFSPSSCSQPATGSAVKCCIIWQSSYGIEYGWSHISNFELEDMILHTNSFRIL